MLATVEQRLEAHDVDDGEYAPPAPKPNSCKWGGGGGGGHQASPSQEGAKSRAGGFPEGSGLHEGRGEGGGEMTRGKGGMRENSGMESGREGNRGAVRGKNRGAVRGGNGERNGEMGTGVGERMLCGGSAVKKEGGRGGG